MRGKSEKERWMEPTARAKGLVEAMGREGGTNRE